MQLWEPTNPASWAEVLGLVHVPLFGRADVPEVRARHAVLLDGATASFHIASSDEPDAWTDRNLQWAWSSNLTHSVAIDAARRVLVLRRWDDRDALRKFALPQRPKGAAELLNVMRLAGPQRGADVVLHMLRAFRALRHLSATDDPLLALRLFNLALVAAESVEQGLLERDALLRANTFAAVLAEVEHVGVDATLIAATGVERERTEPQGQPALVLDYFLAPEPQQQYVLVPSLLMRHASGQLYQEAHLVIEREQRQLLIPGFTPASGGVSTKRDVRFTPSTLARALVEQALTAFSGDAPLPDAFTVLDPACGSGVFLLETLRELISRGYRGTVTMRGFDVSPLSVAMARFCLAHAVHDARDAGFAVTAIIEERNALVDDWGTPDIVLMNPPFVPWENMDANDQHLVREVLGRVARGRIDKAMAFVLRGVQAVRPSGVVASVLPSALLETTSGAQWREALTDTSSLAFVGRFEGFGYFRASMVEPAFIVLQRRADVVPPPAVVNVLIARETAEDEALRALRLFSRGTLPPEPSESWDLFSAPAASFTATSWMPRAQAEQQLIDVLGARGAPLVGDLFDVKQGTRTGANEVFLLSRAELQELPRAEQRFFRPSADNSTIRDGQLLELEYVFYPYDANGLVIGTEEQLASELPQYYTTRLRPAKAKLERRANIPASLWWKLTREREWQHVVAPKLVSTYFGDRGSFAYDAGGRFVIVQGHAWLWKRDTLRFTDLSEDDGGEELTVAFHASPLPWAYLALLNSHLFERLLSTVCPRVQGGQFNLSPRFVERTFLPDLFDESSVPGDAVADLARIGQRINAGKPYRKQELEEFAARAYGVPRTFVQELEQ